MKIKKLIIRLFKWTFISIGILFLLIFGYFEYEEIPIYNLKVAAKFISGKTNYKPYEGLAEKLGYLKDDKLLIIHADDIGLSNSVNQASFKALKNGYVNSGSIMMPCEYISDVGQFAIKNPSIDLGLHLTVTSEWRDYKWNGVLQPNKTPSLINKKGELSENIKQFVLNAEPLELKSELQAQIDLSKSIGINPTHIDSHEGALFYDQDLFKVYLEIGEKNKLPVFVPKMVAVHFDKNFPKPENVVVIENFYMAQKGIKHDEWETFYLDILDNLKPGISQLIVHLGYDDDEMKSITVDHPDFGSKWRNLDYDIVSSDKFKNALKKNKIKLITWKEIQNIIY
ncbi:MAG: polysaccharide deacetylase family protein [Flavobacteriales bacterium]